jgi:hypothetical protein
VFLAVVLAVIGRVVLLLLAGRVR